MFHRSHASEPALHINEIDVNDKYKFLKKIGKGSYGEVWLVVPKKISTQKSHTRQNVLKRLDLRQTANNTSQNDIESAEREAQLLSTLKHPNIVAYTESFRSKDGFLNIVMAYCEGGDLYTKLKEYKTRKESLTENQIIEWFVQICMALQYIHEKNILHRDLKTQNIFLTKNEIVKVGDFGIARVLESGNDFATTIIGTPYYMSPEIFSNKPYGQKSDIWSLGCCLYEMTTLEHAFNAKDVNALIGKILREQTPQMSKKYSEPLRDIIRSMLKKNPEDRPTAKTILQNSYIKQHILRLLEKAQAKCQSQQAKSESQPVLNVSPACSPPRPTSASNPSSACRPISASNPSPSRSRLSARNKTPVLPSYPILPCAHSKPPSSVDTNESTESIMSKPRVRRRLQNHRSNPLPINNDDVDMEFLAKINQNDTLHRFKRNQQLNNYVKQQQQQQKQTSSSDEHDLPNENILGPVIVVNSPQKATRPVSVESSRNSSRPSSGSQITKSCDLIQGANSSARQRRRENKLRSASTEYATANENDLSRSDSQENLSDEIEKKIEREQDMQDFVFELTSTLQLPPTKVPNSNEFIDNNNRYLPEKILSSNVDRTINGPPLHETSRLHELCQSIREKCLEEISPQQLKRVLKILENVSDAQMTQEMINELGEDLYEKYSGEIFKLKFYEDNLLTRS